jgi:hypothetical protein
MGDFERARGLKATSARQKKAQKALLTPFPGYADHHKETKADLLSVGHG